MKRISLTTLSLLAALLGGCAAPTGHGHHSAGGTQGDGQGMKMGHMMRNMAVATVTPTQGNTVRGMVVFHEMNEHVMVHAHFTGLSPNTEHGFHLHDVGNCASADGTSAGGHFNPGKTAHGPQDAEHHAGDMPSLKADANGVIDQKFMLHGVTIKQGANAIDGHSVILHANADDYKTQPTGNSGPRIACGVIAVHP
ncbi:superoxide dismutase family protein [Aquabacterium sp.]|uniref:superoxide dismutase family protein n=1 Tax=Aquabacterium sp. TaxID=1872578 RepID=UPI0025C28218|nr:superoxide dismutase family protein [Aquabacterium sp.]